VARRVSARARKDFASADALREDIRELGYLVEDAAEGPRVVKAGE
jgi:cysteinyl-tRNA synthetase